MRRFILILTILTLICSCQNKSRTRTVEGDLYFKLIDFQRLFNYPDSVLTKIEDSVKTVDKDTLKENDKKIYQLIEFMVDNDLLRKPYIRIKQDNGDIRILFLDPDDYEIFDSYKLTELRKTNKKIRIKAQVTEIKYDTLIAFNAKKLLSIDKIDGRTEFKK